MCLHVLNRDSDVIERCIPQNPTRKIESLKCSTKSYYSLDQTLFQSECQTNKVVWAAKIVQD